MSQCGRTRLLDALTAGELPAALEGELRAHASRCARCHHELNWLESELRLFRQRAGRDEVHALWQGVERRRVALRSSRSRGLLLGLAAAVLVVIGAGRWSLPRNVTAASTAQQQQDEERLQSLLLDGQASEMSAEDPQPCSKLLPGMGFFCGAPRPDVLASR